MSNYYHFKDKKYWRNHWWDEHVDHTDWDSTAEERAEDLAFNFGFDCGYGEGLADAKELRSRNEVLVKDNEALHDLLKTRARLDKEFSTQEELDYINKFMDDEQEKASQQVRA